MGNSGKSQLKWSSFFYKIAGTIVVVGILLFTLAIVYTKYCNCNISMKYMLVFYGMVGAFVLSIGAGIIASIWDN